MAISAGSFTAEAVSPGLWKVVQDDLWKQYPFAYVIVGERRVVLIDTGAPQPSGMTYKTFLDENLNKAGLPYLVLCSHVHFDHIGGAHAFSEAGVEVWMGGADKKFAGNYELTSLAAGQSGCQVKDFRVTRWLEDGEVVPIDDGGSLETGIEVIFTPGHTPDGICLYSRRDKRLFVADMLYPYTCVNVDGLGSNAKDYYRSMKKLSAFVAAQGGSAVVHAGSALPPAGPPPLPPQCRQFLETMGLTEDAVSSRFSVRTLLQLCDDSVEQAIDMYVTSQDEIPLLAPPDAPVQPAAPPVASAPSSGVLVAGGHVETGMPADCFDQVLALMEAVAAGALPPISVDEGYGEFNNGQFNLMLPFPLALE
eukprot:TRINITY_DN36377_c0_g1_i1.p1 TRINITY_DN36377_c0_g1~~TRINITY_DN36377_c0_g1_i1.p1  ORF type:complete len:365 (+),score=76.95 TRINITY_DN36377_c0_g1_i1:49-1143(+)